LLGQTRVHQVYQRGRLLQVSFDTLSLGSSDCLPFVAVASPALPDSSREDSPTGAFNISKNGATITNAGFMAVATPEDEGPSAADYDPTVDMREDNKRYEQHIHDHEAPSGACDVTKAIVRDEQTPASLPKQESQQESTKKEDDDDFDMFAEGDDDDMFAGPIPKAKKAESQTNKTHPIVSDAKQLDASLLDNWDDPDGYYRVIPAELLDGRYRVQTNLGRGMFSGVVRALDLTTQKLVAIKIIRNNETMYVLYTLILLVFLFSCFAVLTAL